MFGTGPFLETSPSMHPPRPIRFWYRGTVQTVQDSAPTRSVLDWLREDARCTGTKEGCNEGDCGACTVIVAEPAARAEAIGTPSARAAVVGGLLLRPLNACLLFLPTLDGKALLTVEDLAGPAAAALPDTLPEPPRQGHPADPATLAHAHPGLHPAQQALVACHGSQCGFCTPGFAMSLAACYEAHQSQGTRPDRAALADVLAGNLCRCTGYRPLLDAGERMFELPVQRLDTAPITAALATLAGQPALVYAGPNAARTDGAPQLFHAPRSVADFAHLREALPAARVLAGATDLGLWVNKQLRDLGEIVYIGEVDALRRIEPLADGGLRLGAAAPLEDAWAALAGRWPAFTSMWKRFASPPVRHAGTLGGNLANGSPIGDGAPVLMALDATLLLRRGDAQRRLPLDAFYLDYQKNQLAPGEFIEAVEVPPQPDGALLRAEKVAKRHDSDISAVSLGLRLVLDGGQVAGVRLAYGGLAATVRRATQAEAALAGRPWDEATLADAEAALARDFQPLSDLRASAAYRQRVAAALLRRIWLETRLHDPLPPAATRLRPQALDGTPA
jgi:xanthine dehydrogenase small subunit